VATRLLAPSANRPAGEGEQPAPPTAAVEELRTLRGAAAAKFKAANDGESVRVAPQIGNSDPKPRSNPPEAAPADQQPPAKDGVGDAQGSKRID
jgi:hypothetical protein